MAEEPRQVIVARVQGKKSDGSFEDIVTDDAGKLQVWDPKVGSLISYTGTTTADGAPLGASLIDDLLVPPKPDFDGCLVIITSGACAGQSRDINGITTGGTITPSIHFGSPTGAGVQIVAGTSFVIVGITTTPAEVAALTAALAAHEASQLTSRGVITDIHGTDLPLVKADTAAILIDTADMQPKLGAPAGASISADILTKPTLAQIEASAVLAKEASITALDGVVDAGFVAGAKSAEITALDGVVDAGFVAGAKEATLGAPAGASISADIANVDGDLVAAVIDIAATHVHAAGAETQATAAAASLANGGFTDLLIDAIKLQTDKVANFQHEVEWSSTPAIDQVASVNATSLTVGTIIPTFPAGATEVRAILIASIHAANFSAATHHVTLKVQGKKDAGGYGDLIDLTAQPPIGLVNLDGAGDGWAGSVDVTALVDASASTYLFKFIVDSDNAGAVNYTSSFVLVLVYKI